MAKLTARLRLPVGKPPVVRFPGAHALITGGSSGIGEATALALAQRGARVTLLARDPDRLRAAADRIEEALATRSSVDATTSSPQDGRAAARDGQVGVVSVDVADRDAVTDGFASIVAERGEVDVLVTSAGITRPGRFTELPDDVFTSMIDVDYFGTLWPIREVVPSMMRRGSGSIVAVSSAAAIVGIYGYSAYGAAKFAVRGLCESLRTELAPYGVRVACAYPADVDTPMLAEEERFKPAETAAIAGSIQPVQPGRVATAIVAGIERGRAEIYADGQTRALARTATAVPGVFRTLFDRRVRTAGSDRG